MDCNLLENDARHQDQVWLPYYPRLRDASSVCLIHGCSHPNHQSLADRQQVRNQSLTSNRYNMLVKKASMRSHIPIKTCSIFQMLYYHLFCR